MDRRVTDECSSGETDHSEKQELMTNSSIQDFIAGILRRANSMVMPNKKKSHLRDSDLHWNQLPLTEADSRKLWRTRRAIGNVSF